MSNKQIEAMKLALKALENSYALRDDIIDAKEALREALAQQSAERGEPVAEYIGECSDGSLVQLYDDIKKGAKLYAVPQAQPAREPLTDEPEIVQRVKRYAGQTLQTARNPNITARECIELANWLAAHGINAKGGVE